MRDFYLTANIIGIRLPYVPLFLRDEINAISRFDHEGYPFEEMQQIAALAQHYGLPTRLLDWSYNIFSALFFAANGITDGVPKNPKIVLWCLKQSMISLEYNRITKVVTNYADNPNINAQKGLFFYWADTPGFPRKVKDLYKPIISRPLDEYLNDLYLAEKGNENLKNAVKCGGPVLLKITLPAENAEKIAKYLSAFGYTKATTFPSLDGAVSETKKHFSL